MQLFQTAFTLLGAGLVSAHVSLISPCVRYTPYCTSCPELPSGQSLDYSINSPIGTHESTSQPLCKYTTPYATPAVTWKAGSTVEVKFREHAAVHGGGHCQFALSYDGGESFVVIHDELRYCFTGGPSSSNKAAQLSYSIALPQDLPSGDKVVFAWAWNNNQGNREFYMNCADVAIEGSGSSFTGPKLLVANYGPDSPFIPEFNGDYDTGIDLFNSRPMITVSGSGGYSGGGMAANSTGGAYSGDQQPSYDSVASTAAPTLPDTSSNYGPTSSAPASYEAPSSAPPAAYSGSAAGASDYAASAAPVYRARVASIPASPAPAKCK
ncbi:hypothetical protein H4R22_003635 [Coemansia sp. RSA 1290]|nr:hypothetical protein H4R22_003635 [Coemansia sp. RSA 1290]KAJ2649858.1 hypothetical protein IWW40_002869 [Coemansia sp. RSA 1250]